MNAVERADRIVRSAYRREVIKRLRGILAIGVLIAGLLLYMGGAFLIGYWLGGGFS